MPNLEKILTSLEAGRKIQEFLGKDAPGSYFVYYELPNKCTGKKHPKNEHPSKYTITTKISITTPKGRLLPAYDFATLITEVLPKIAERKTTARPQSWCVHQSEMLFHHMMSGGMEAVSERIISIIKENAPTL